MSSNFSVKSFIGSMFYVGSDRVKIHYDLYFHWTKMRKKFKNFMWNQSKSCKIIDFYQKIKSVKLINFISRVFSLDFFLNFWSTVILNWKIMDFIFWEKFKILREIKAKVAKLLILLKNFQFWNAFDFFFNIDYLEIQNSTLKNILF